MKSQTPKLNFILVSILVSFLITIFSTSNEIGGFINSRSHHSTLIIIIIVLIPIIGSVLFAFIKVIVVIPLIIGVESFGVPDTNISKLIPDKIRTSVKITIFDVRDLF